jgi:hypothetical protein
MAYPEKDAQEGAKPKDLLDEARRELKACIDEEDAERAKMQDDLRFCTLDQWPADIRKERENDLESGPRPCLTIDKINQYIVQVVNDVRQGKPGVNVRPQDDAADIQTAKVLKGIIRNIEDQSSADIAYATAVESAARIGLGYIRVTAEYTSDDSFDQELFIRPVPNTFSVYLGKHIHPDGSDAETAFICEPMPIEKFKEEYPGKKFKSEDFDGFGAQVSGYWRTAETIMVVEYYCFERRREKIHFLADGTTMSDEMYKKWPVEAGPKPAIQKSRDVLRKQLMWTKMTGVEVLDSRELPGKYIPIAEVVGREAWVDGRRVLWGLVRPAKDVLRMYNYFASTITERMGLAPKVPFIGAKGQFEGLEHIWRDANRKNRAYLEYNLIDVNGNAVPAPQRVGPTPIEAALLKQMEVIEHDVQTSLGMFRASVGESESQQSGRAILALQRESDTGTYHFGANLGVSIRHIGRILVDLIPPYYDTRRIVRILGEDGEPQSVSLDPDQQVARVDIQTAQGVKSIHNPGVGEYDVSITVGPSYNTKRMEAAATFVELAKGAADPATALVMSYLTVRNSDFNGAEDAAKMIKALLPPQVLQAVSPGGPQTIPPEVQAQMQQAQLAVQALQQHNQELVTEIQQLKAGAQQEAAKIQSEHDTEMQRIGLDARVEGEKAKLAREKAEAELALKRAIAKAELEIEDLKLAAEHDRAERELTRKPRAPSARRTTRSRWSRPKRTPPSRRSSCRRSTRSPPR